MALWREEIRGRETQQQTRRGERERVGEGGKEAGRMRGRERERERERERRGGVGEMGWAEVERFEWKLQLTLKAAHYLS